MQGSLKELLTLRKVILASLFLLLLIDSSLAPKHSVPGGAVSFALAWVFGTRVWLRNPSNVLLVICIAVASACVASNHGLLSLGIIPQPFYFYFGLGALIIFWEKATGLANVSGDRSG
jgi:hypothetical protein